MEIIIATIGTALVVTGIIIAMTTEVVTPVNFKEKIENETSICIVENNGEINCLLKNTSLNEQK